MLSAICRASVNLGAGSGYDWRKSFGDCMLIFIPLLSVVYTIFRKVVYQRLKKRHIKQVTATDIEEYTEKETASTDKI